MAYLFVDDGSHEADEYTSNYIYFDENDPASVQNALKLARSRKAGQPTPEELSCANSGNFPAFTSRRFR